MNKKLGLHIKIFKNTIFTNIKLILFITAIGLIETLALAAPLLSNALELNYIQLVKQGKYFSYLGQCDKAIVAFNKVIHIKKYTSYKEKEIREDAIYNKGICLHKMGYYDSAIEHFYFVIQNSSLTSMKLEAKYAIKMTLENAYTKTAKGYKLEGDVFKDSSKQLTYKSTANNISYYFNPYMASISYKGDTDKMRANIFGFYATRYNFSNLIEIGLDKTTITRRKELLLDDYEQIDLTLTYSIYHKNTYQFKLGTHFIDSTEETLKGSNIILAQVKSFTLDYSNFGFDLYYSSYSKMEPSSVTAAQLSPFFQKVWKKSTLTIGFDYIAHNYSPEVFISKTKSNSFAVSLKGTYTFKKLTFSFDILQGDNRFSVRNSGFVVYDTPDLYESIYTTGLLYTIGPKSNISLNASNSKFIPTGYLTESTSSSLALLYGRSF